MLGLLKLLSDGGKYLFENSPKMISGILGLKIIEKPDVGIVGLKWEEKRLMFNKEPTEVMCVTEAVENQFYKTRAENHGAVYITKLSLSKKGKNTLLTMSFGAKAPNFFVRAISAVMGFLVKNSIRKLLYKDLEDIKQYVEKG